MFKLFRFSEVKSMQCILHNKQPAICRLDYQTCVHLDMTQCCLFKVEYIYKNFGKYDGDFLDTVVAGTDRITTLTINIYS